MLEDNDSFVYLSAVHTLRAMFDHSSGYLIVHLMQLFENSDSWAKYDHSTRQSTVVVNITRKRVLLAESIMFGVIRAGATIPLYAGEIINGCMRVIRAENSISRPVVLHISKWDMQKMTLREEQQQDDTTSLSLRRVKKQTDAGQEAEHVDSILLRQSALSLMAEVVSIAGYGSSRYLNEVIQLAVDVLSVEHSSANAAISMRR